jgi:hypothetical protein
LHSERRGGGGLEMQDPYEIIGDVNATVILGLKMKYTIKYALLWIQDSSKHLFYE